ncbi:MAG: hypothetical protein ACYC91_01620 [Solirubrobacteraceae bacterium]
MSLAPARGATRRLGLLRRATVGRVLAVGLASTGWMTLAGSGAAARAAGWLRPFTIAPAAARDLLAPQFAPSPSGLAALGFSSEDPDRPSLARAYVVLPGRDRLFAAPQHVKGAEQVLAMGYDGSDLDVLVGASPRGLACCSSVRALTLGPRGRLVRRRLLVSGLAGATVAQLVEQPGGVLASIATERGVWISLSRSSGPFGVAKRVSADGTLPELLGSAAIGPDASIVAWTARRGLYGPPPRTITAATNQGGGVRGEPKTVVSVPAAHTIDELAVAGGPRGGPILAWVESWDGVSGRYHSEVRLTDPDRGVPIVRVSAAADVASGLSLTSDSDGNAVLAWRACRSDGGCVVRAALKPAGRRIAAAVGLGAIDPGELPVVAANPWTAGRTGVGALVGWISHGHVLAAAARPGAARVGTTRIVSRTDFASDLTLAFTARGEGLAAWIQGTFAQSIVGASYRG